MQYSKYDCPYIISDAHSTHNLFKNICPNAQVDVALNWSRNLVSWPIVKPGQLQKNTLVLGIIILAPFALSLHIKASYECLMRINFVHYRVVMVWLGASISSSLYFIIHSLWWVTHRCHLKKKQSACSSLNKPPIAKCPFLFYSFCMIYL